MLQVAEADTGRVLGKLETSPDQWRELIEATLGQLREAHDADDFNRTQGLIAHVEDLLSWVTTFRKGDETAEVFGNHPEMLTAWRAELERCSEKRNRAIELVAQIERRFAGMQRTAERARPASVHQLWDILTGEVALDTGEHLLEGLDALVSEACGLLGPEGILRTPSTEASHASLREGLAESKRVHAWLKSHAKRISMRR